MSYAEDRPKLLPTFSEESRALAAEWRRLRRAATLVALLTAPATLFFLTLKHDWPIGWALLVTFLTVIAFRGLVDVLAHKLIPRASLYGAEKPLLEEDVVARRRVWYWRTKWRRWTFIVGSLFALLVAINLIHNAADGPASLRDTLSMIGSGAPMLLVSFLPYLFLFPMLFLFNFLILFGPLVFFGIKQMKAYEPGDADWGVRLDDVRGQAEPKEDVTRVISLWQSGEEFRAAGGKPERGLLFIGAPGTGKTMLSKGIATSFNSPIMMMPGSGFASTPRQALSRVHGRADLPRRRRAGACGVLRRDERRADGGRLDVGLLQAHERRRRQWGAPDRRARGPAVSPADG